MAVLHDRRHWALIPDCATACGCGAIEEPALLVVADGALFTLTLSPPTDETPAKLVVERDRIDPDRGRVRLEESYLDNHRSVRRRRWSLVINGHAEPLKIESEQLRAPGPSDELRPPLTEKEARALARQLGYEVEDD
jgi:hypothetical protein